MTTDRDILAEALARLKREGLSQEPPRTVVDETLRWLADAQPAAAGLSGRTGDSDCRRVTARRMAIRLSLAAAALILLGFAIGRLSRPAAPDVEELRALLAPSVAAAIEPAIREKLIEDLHQRYQVALAATYVKVKEELTEQYRDDLNRFAVQTLAASNATTNRLLAELVESIDTAQTQDLTRIAKALHQIELNRMQDKTQLATGLQTLASRTEDELSRTRREFAQLLVNVAPEEIDMRPNRQMQPPMERNEQ